MGGIFSPESSVSLPLLPVGMPCGLVTCRSLTALIFISIHSYLFGISWNFGPHRDFYGFCTDFRLGSVSLGVKVLNTLYSTRQLLITYRERSNCRSDHVHVSAHVVPMCQFFCVSHGPPYPRIAVLYELIAVLHWPCTKVF